MTIIEQIKAEIERRMKILREDEVVRQNCTSDFLEGKIYGYEEVLSFLSTLEESEKPMQEGLEEEYKDYVESDPVYSKLVNRIAGLSIARHFAQWGAEHAKKDEIPVPADLEEAALSRMRDPDMYLSEAVIDEIGDALLEMAEFGAKWQKEQMLNEAVEVENVVEEGRYCQEIGPIFLDERAGFKPGDKVRVIIVSNQK